MSKLVLRSTQPAIQLVLGIERLGLEADSSPPTGIEAKKIEIYTSTYPYAFLE
jgi:hypothetical protein